MPGRMIAGASAVVESEALAAARNFQTVFPIAPEAQDAKGLLLQSLFPADASDLSQTTISNLHLDLRLAPLPPDTDEFNGFCTHEPIGPRFSSPGRLRSPRTLLLKEVDLFLGRRTRRRSSGDRRGKVHPLENRPNRVGTRDERHDPQPPILTARALQPVDIEDPRQKLRPRSLRGLPSRKVRDLQRGESQARLLTQPTCRRPVTTLGTLGFLRRHDQRTKPGPGVQNAVKANEVLPGAGEQGNQAGTPGARFLAPPAPLAP